MNCRTALGKSLSSSRIFPYRSSTPSSGPLIARCPCFQGKHEPPLRKWTSNSYQHHLGCQSKVCYDFTIPVCYNKAISTLRCTNKSWTVIPSLMKVILPSKSFEHARKLSTRSTPLAIPVIVDISKLSRSTQRNSSVSSNKHNHNRYNPKQHVLLHTASTSFPFRYVHPYILWIPTLYSLHELLNQYPLNPKTQLPQPLFPLHSKPGTSHRQSDLIPQHS